MIPRVNKGDTPTLLDADFANKLIDFVNGIEQGKVTPAGAGKFVFGPQGMTLDLAQVKATAQAGSPDLGPLQAQIAILQGQVGAIVSSLKAATITAECNEDGTITVTLTFPKLP